MVNKEKKPLRAKWIALLTAVAVLGISIGVALGNQPSSEGSATAESYAQLTSMASTSTELESPFKAVYQDASQSVVGIRLTTQTRVYNGRITSNTSFVGSGVVISDDGYVVTNYHVVSAGTSTVASEISVVYGEKEYPAEYIAGDEDSDIAVLKVDGLNAPAAKIGNSDELTVGDWALVIGNPLGEEFANTLTVGVISGLQRDMTSTDRNGNITGTEMIQTNAAINSGNSGGGLFNIRGELVGITSMKLSNNGFYGMASIEGIGFAVPINTVANIVDDLIEYGKVREPVYPRIGVGIYTVNSPSDEPTSEYLPRSIWVSSVEKGSPADEAGIQVDDLIMEADGERVRTSEELQAIVRSHEAGETVEITVYRIPGGIPKTDDKDIPEGEYLTLEVELKILDE